MTYPQGDGIVSRSLLFAPAAVAPTALVGESSPQASAPGTYAYVQGTPITCYTPHLVAAAAVKPMMSLKDHQFVFLTDQPDVWLEIENSVALAELAYTVICPAGARFGH